MDQARQKIYSFSRYTFFGDYQICIICIVICIAPDDAKNNKAENIPPAPEINIQNIQMVSNLV